MMRLYILALGLLAAIGASAQNFSVTFRVDMAGQTVGASGVHIAGDFQSEAGAPSDWTPNTTPLSDSNNDQVYVVTVQIPAGTYAYKFINGNAWGSDETPPAACGVDNGFGGFNRQVVVGGDTTLPAVKYASCEITVVASIADDLNALRPARILPNPASSFAVLEFSNAGGQPYRFLLSDLQGRVVREVSDLRAESLRIERGNLPAGLYTASLINESGEMYSLKVAFQ